MKKCLIICCLILGYGFTLKSQTVIPFGISKDSIYPSYLNIDGNAYSQEWAKKRSFYLYKPISYNALTSPILFAMHGEGGDGLGPINDLIAIADRRNALIICINNNAPHAAEYRYIDSSDQCLVIVPDVYFIRQLYKYVLNKENMTSAPVYMIGFSAGGQFVSRYMLIRQAYPDSVPIKMAVSTNPYYYTFPTDTFNGVPMPWLSGLIFPSADVGLGQCLENDKYYTFKCPDHIKQYYNENYGVLIGTGDTAPLSDNASAMAQGSNRYQRAQTFYNFGLTDAPNYGTTLNWKYREVIGVGHNQNQMYNNKNLTTDTFTIAERLLFDTPYTPTTQYAPVASFTADVISTSLPNATVSFTNNSFGATAYEWDFGDGNTSTSVNPVHTYTNAATTTTVNNANGTFTVAGQYFMVQLKATSANGCSNWDVKRHYIRVLPDNTTEVNELGLNNRGLLIMPNPSNEDCKIQIQGLQKDGDKIVIELYNYAGQLVKTINSQEQDINIDTKELSSGIYLVKVTCNESVLVDKLIVEH